MKTCEFSDLRKRANLTQSQVALALGVSSRTISGWENNPEKELSRIEARAIRDLFTPPLIEPRLSEMTQKAFDAIPSELVAVWLMQQGEVILMPCGARHHDLQRNTKSEFISPTCIQPLVKESLTTYPLRTGETINLAGDAITEHPAKKYKGARRHGHFSGGRCESLLHVPAFKPSATGPRPVLLLSLENKLDEHGRVIAPKKGQREIYTAEDKETASRLANEFKQQLIDDMVRLEMVGADSD